jgi:asparagine synthase (glutamine-hydrolysing)
MCGIFTLLNYYTSFPHETITEEFKKGYKRGPEFSVISFRDSMNFVQGFHRLAINGLNEKSNQPFSINGVSLICNGEIYNYKYLYSLMDITPETDSDCEVIIHLYTRYGMDQTLRMLDGVYSFVLQDKNRLYVARDPFGVRPLYMTGPEMLGFSSEVKMLCELARQKDQKVDHFPPSSYVLLTRDSENNVWGIRDLTRHHYPSFAYSSVDFKVECNMIQKIVLEGIRDKLEMAVKKRYFNTERPIACMLSGGLDSSIIAALVCKIHKEQGKDPSTIETYSIGLPDSEDIKYARYVAKFIGSKHTELIVSEDTMIDAIPEVIEALESYDITTVRASLGHYIIGKFVANNSEAKVIFNGDGSDEVCGGYLYMKNCPDSIEYDKEILRLLRDIYMFDVLRSDKSISSNGLEPRTPFLDKEFVNFYLSIPVELRDHNRNKNMEKYLIRTAFSFSNILPTEILWRKKEAFSDGVSKKDNSLFEILQDWIDNNFMVDSDISKKEKEKLYYKDIFEKLYPGQTHLVPYYWMPKFIQSDDPSARTLSTYS